MTKSVPNRLLGLIVLLIATYTTCLGQEDFEGFPYDPEGATITTDKEIERPSKKTIEFPNDGVWISNEFSGARMSKVKKVNKHHYQILITPEMSPINNSPWYAFKIGSDTSVSVTIDLVYKEGTHRYHPKKSFDGKHWEPIPEAQYREHNDSATITVHLDQAPMWISAQELLTRKYIDQWLQKLAADPHVTLHTAGYSHDRQTIPKLHITAPSQRKKGVLILMARQHPPEITGALASQVFIETVASSHPIAVLFRQQFEVRAYPLINPDGVTLGHWRQNAVGVDLNRDWKAFNQPETKSIRRDLLKLKTDSLRKVFYAIDFHSTNDNILYPIQREASTFPEDFTYRWIDSLQSTLPDFSFRVEPFDTRSPVAKNWIYHTFGADAVTYEMDDSINRDTLRRAARKSALLVMQHLLDEKRKQSTSPPIK